jgi:large subunit ribosomal protein L10
MPSIKKQQTVTELTEKAARSESIIFAKYTGLNVAQFTDLRQKIKAAGGEIVVTRNRLINIALGKPEGLINQLQDQLFTLFSYDDPVSPIKVLYEFKKDNEAVQIRAGFFEDKVITADQVDTLSKIPGRTELMGTLARTLQGPAYGLRNVLSAGPQKLALALQAVAQKKQESNA